MGCLQWALLNDIKRPFHPQITAECSHKDTRSTLVHTIMNVLCRKRLVVALRTHIRAKRRVNHTHFVRSSSARSIRVLPQVCHHRTTITFKCGRGSKGSSRHAPQWLIKQMNNACTKQSLDMHGLYREEKTTNN